LTENNVKENIGEDLERAGKLLDAADLLFNQKEPTNWRSWEGILVNINALQDHVAEHAEEVDR
jgi:hypothetical protein